MSVIWRAFDQSLQRMVAVKVLDGSFDGDRGGRELIRHEARAAARLLHPDVIEVYDYGETITSRGRVAAFVVMRLLEGRPLAERLLDGPLPWREAVGIALRLALVLSAAHARGIVHRDVTPENVLLTGDGAKLLDFGIAAIEDDQGNERLADFGTPPYVAPERLRGVPADPAIDVYALGVLLFQMLTGELPYPERTWEAIEAVRRIGLPPSPAVPGLPPEVAVLCQRCLSQEPGRRPSAQHLADVLARVSASRHPRRPRRRWVMLTVTVVAVFAAGLAWTNSAGTPGQTIDAARLWPNGTPTASGTPAAPETAGATELVTEPQETARARNPSGRPKSRASRGNGVDTGTDTGPPTRPTSAATPPQSPPTVAEAVGHFDSLLAKGMADQEVRPDVAHDLRQVLHNVVGSAADPGPGIANVRRKLADREREGTVSSSLSADLGEQLTEIRAALEQVPRKA
jgi:serine/threonine protein kinase